MTEPSLYWTEWFQLYILNITSKNLIEFIIDYRNKYTGIYTVLACLYPIVLDYSVHRVRPNTACQ